MGSVEFIPQRIATSESTTTYAKDETLMTLDFTFVAPRVVSSLFRRSGKVRQYTEEVLLGNMLRDFKDVVMEEDVKGR